MVKESKTLRKPQVRWAFELVGFRACKGSGSIQCDAHSEEPLSSTASWAHVDYWQMIWWTGRSRKTLSTSLRATDQTTARMPRPNSTIEEWLRVVESTPGDVKSCIRPSSSVRSRRTVRRHHSEPQGSVRDGEENSELSAHVKIVQGLTGDVQVSAKAFLQKQDFVPKHHFSKQCSAPRLGPPRVASGGGHDLARVMTKSLAPLAGRSVTRVLCSSP